MIDGDGGGGGGADDGESCGGWCGRAARRWAAQQGEPGIHTRRNRALQRCGPLVARFVHQTKGCFFRRVEEQGTSFSEPRDADGTSAQEAESYRSTGLFFALHRGARAAVTSALAQAGRARRHERAGASRCSKQGERTSPRSVRWYRPPRRDFAKIYMPSLKLAAPESRSPDAHSLPT